MNQDTPSVSETENIFRYIFEHISDGVNLVDAETKKISMVNPAFCRMLGYTREEFSGIRLYDLHPSESVPHIEELFVQLLNREIEQAKDIMVLRKDGTVFYADVSSSPMPYKGKPHLLSTFRNITERKEAERMKDSAVNAFRRNEELLRTTLNTTADGILVVDKDGKISHINRQFITLWKIPQPILDLNNDEKMLDFVLTQVSDPAAFRKRVEELYKSQQAAIEEIRLKDGRIFERFTSPVLNEGREFGRVWDFRDITQSKSSEEEIKKNESVLRSIFEASSAGIALLIDRTLIKINHSLCRITGYSEEDLLGKTTQHLYFNEKEYKQIEETYRQMAQCGFGMTESRLKRKDGSEINVLICLSPVNSKDFKTGIIATVLDITDRKHAELALKDSEEKYRTLVDNMQDAVYRCDLKGNLIFTSPSAARLLGFPSADSMKGLNIARDLYYYPEKREALIRILKEKGKITNYEVVLRRRDNKPVIISTNSQFFYDKDGRVMGIEGVYTDITERKNAEEALRKSEALFSTLFEASPAGILLLVDRIPVKLNRSFCRITGYSQEEILGHSTRHLYFNDEEYARVGQAYKQMNSEGLSLIEACFRRKDGSVMNTLICLSPVSREDEKAGTVAVCLDITDRKHAELALKDSEEKYRTLVDNMQDAVYRCDLEGNITFTTPSAARLLGYPSAESLIGMNLCRDFYINPQEREKLIKTIKEQGKARHFEVVLKRRDDKPVIVSTNSQFFHDKDGRVIGVEGVFSDITEQKKMEAEKSRLEEMLLHSQKIESIGRLAGGIAHDFNNMLTAILGFTGMAMTQLNPAGEVYSLLTEVTKAADAAVNLTKQLLVFSRKQVIEPKIINLNEVIEIVRKMILTLISENTMLHFIPYPELYCIKADHGQIQQIIINLAANARDAMPDGGKLVIETSNVYLDDEYSKNHVDVMPGEYVMLAVSDTGTGMSKDILDHIFEPFFTTKEKGRGTGLGLATVYGIVKQNRGTIEVYSEISHGTIFKLYFPRSLEAETEPVKAPAGSVIPRGTETILIVEDKAQVLAFTRSVLIQLGYNVLAAASGEEALTVAGNYKERIDLLLTDVILPGINGRVTSERISLMHPELKTLYNSGYTAEVIDKQGVLEQGVNFISKPFTSQELSHKVRAILDK